MTAKPGEGWRAYLDASGKVRDGFIATPKVIALLPPSIVGQTGKALAGLLFSRLWSAAKYRAGSGDDMPSEAELAAKLGCERKAIAKGKAQLVHAGILILSPYRPRQVQTFDMALPPKADIQLSRRRTSNGPKSGHPVAPKADICNGPQSGALNPGNVGQTTGSANADGEAIHYIQTPNQSTPPPECRDNPPAAATSAPASERVDKATDADLIGGRAGNLFGGEKAAAAVSVSKPRPKPSPEELARFIADVPDASQCRNPASYALLLDDWQRKHATSPVAVPEATDPTGNTSGVVEPVLVDAGGVQ